MVLYIYSATTRSKAVLGIRAHRMGSVNLGLIEHPWFISTLIYYDYPGQKVILYTLIVSIATLWNYLERREQTQAHFGRTEEILSGRKKS